MKKKGFTLIELLAVIAIIAIVSLAGVATYNAVKKSIEEGLFKSKLTTLVESAKLYGEDIRDSIGTKVIINGEDYTGVNTTAGDLIDSNYFSTEEKSGDEYALITNIQGDDTNLNNLKLYIYLKANRVNVCIPTSQEETEYEKVKDYIIDYACDGSSSTTPESDPTPDPTPETEETSVSNACSIIKNSSNVSSILLGGMYRYQGWSETSGETENVVDNNYVCFNATGTDCTNENNLYRIIGITDSCNIKLQKYKSIGNYRWYANGTTNITGFEQSEIYTLLNSGDYYKSIGSKWLNLVEDWTWKTGTILLEDKNNENKVSFYFVGNTFYSEEESLSDYVTKYKFSLFSPSDYAYAQLGSKTGNETVTFTDGSKTWIFNSNYQDWTNAYYGYNNLYNDSKDLYAAWFVDYGNGHLRADYSGLEDKFAVRPVFYLKSTVSIKSGTGTATDPYILDVTSS